MLKKLLIITGIILIFQSARAQDGIDTALFKQYKVKKMWVWVKLPIFEKRTLNDSCKVEVYEFDTFNNITYQHNIQSCYGWSGSTENFNTYDSKNLLIFARQKTEEGEIHINYFYNWNNDVVKAVQTRPGHNDSFVTHNKYTYNKKGKPTQMNILNIEGTDTSRFIIKYEYDKAENVQTIYTYTGEMKLIQKQTYDITPVSKKLLEFTNETKWPSEKYTKGFNYYNFDAQLVKTQYSNNTWTEFVYKDNGLLDQTFSYNMLGKLNALKTYYYEFYDQ